MVVRKTSGRKTAAGIYIIQVSFRPASIFMLCLKLESSHKLTFI